MSLDVYPDPDSVGANLFETVTADSGTVPIETDPNDNLNILGG